MQAMHEYKPPRVRFEMREVEDRNASIKAGRKCYKNVAWAIVNPAGSKDEVERNADEWIASLQANIMRYGDDPERLNFEQRLLEAVERAYESFKSGNVMPETGTPIRMCLMFTPAEQRAIINANILTLEELAEANEQALGGIGMGGRELKQRAQRSISASENGGKAAEKINALEVQNAALLERIKALEEALGTDGTTPEQQQAAPKRRGRPPKVTNVAA